MKKNKTITLVIGGQAGDGTKEATVNLGRVFAKLGYDFFLSTDYPSLIRGGHNFSRLSVNQKEKILSDYSFLDVLIAFDKNSILVHKKEFKKDTIIFADADISINRNNIFKVPLKEWIKEENFLPIMRSSAMLGVVMWYLNFPLNILNKVFINIFKDKASPNILLAKKGYNYAKKNNWPQINFLQIKKQEKSLLDGNTAFAEGLVSAGLNNYFAYPMTPSTSILHYLASKAKEYKLKVIQPENEIAVINMAIGSVFTGSRTAVASTGGGVVLMLEAIAMAGMMEVPIVVANSQRASTSTGVPTRVAQGDINFILNLPGEYPFIVLSPSDAEEAYQIGGLALNLAWQFQVPVLVLLDKHLSESVSTVDLKKYKIKPLPHRLGRTDKNYTRYSFMPDGISPLCFPGDDAVVVKQNSYEHDEFGYASEDPKNTQKMVEKRFKKTKEIAKEMKKNSPLKIFGNKQSKNIVIFTGSTKGAILEAIKNCGKSIKAIQILWLEPFPVDELTKELKGAKKIICVEMNYTGQLEKLIKSKVNFKMTNIRQYNSLPFSPEFLIQKFNTLF